jgi:hypothetical protein
VKGVGEPGDREGHARIDEEELETCETRHEGWRLQATDGGGQAVPLIGRAARRANSLLYFARDNPGGTSTIFGTGSRRKYDATWGGRGSEQVSAGEGGVGTSSTACWGCTVITVSDTVGPFRKHFQHDRTHNPWCEVSRRAGWGKSPRPVRGGGDWNQTCTSSGRGLQAIVRDG